MHIYQFKIIIKKIWGGDIFPEIFVVGVLINYSRNFIYFSFVFLTTTQWKQGIYCN